MDIERVSGIVILSFDLAHQFFLTNHSPIKTHSCWFIAAQHILVLLFQIQAHVGHSVKAFKFTVLLARFVNFFLIVAVSFTCSLASEKIYSLDPAQIPAQIINEVLTQ